MGRMGMGTIGIRIIEIIGKRIIMDDSGWDG